MSENHTESSNAVFYRWLIASLSRWDGPGVVLDVLLHLLLFFKLQSLSGTRRSLSWAQFWGICASLLLAVCQGAWLVTHRRSYCRHRLPIIIVSTRCMVEFANEQLAPAASTPTVHRAGAQLLWKAYSSPPG